VIKVNDRSVQPAPSIEEMRGQLINNLSRQNLARILEEMRAGVDISVRDFADIAADAQAADEAANAASGN